MTQEEPKRKKRNTSPQNPYTGKAGHLAVMAELAWRGYNVALPEIDKGDDIFAVDDRDGKLWRIQVKTGRLQKSGRQYQVNIKESQIVNEGTTELQFVFALRIERVGPNGPPDHWRFIVLSRKKLKGYVDSKTTFGSLKKDGRRMLTITLNRLVMASCSRTPWTTHMEDWEVWPRIAYIRPATNDGSANVE